MESSAQLLQKAVQYLDLFSEVSLSAKIVLGFVLALILVLFALVSERCLEARIYNRRKILFGHSQRIARARLPPLSSPHMLVNQIPPNLNDGAEITSVI